MTSSHINGFSLSFMLHALFACALFFFMQSRDVVKESDTLKRFTISLSSFETPPEAVQHKNTEAETPRPHRKAKHHGESASGQAKKEMQKSNEAEILKAVMTKELTTVITEPMEQKGIPIPLAQEAAASEPLENMTKAQEAPSQKVPSAQEPQEEFIKTNFQSIREIVLAHLKYPNNARRMGLQGVVELILVIDTNGKLLDVILHKSSGHAILDRSVLEAADILCNTALPKPKNIAKITIPIHFALN